MNWKLEEINGVYSIRRTEDSEFLSDTQAAAYVKNQHQYGLDKKCTSAWKKVLETNQKQVIGASTHMTYNQK